MLGLGYDQVVAGWRVPNVANKTGIKLYVPEDKSNTKWNFYWIDENGMAAEDLQVLDMNGDGSQILLRRAVLQKSEDILEQVRIIERFCLQMPEQYCQKGDCSLVVRRSATSFRNKPS